VCWTVSGKAKYPQGIGQMIYSATKDPLISLPTIEEHHICFPYISLMVEYLRFRKVDQKRTLFFDERLENEGFSF